MSCAIEEDQKVDDEWYTSNTHRRQKNNWISTCFVTKDICAVFGAAQTVRGDAQKMFVSSGGAVAMTYALNPNLTLQPLVSRIPKLQLLVRQLSISSGAGMLTFQSMLQRLCSQLALLTTDQKFLPFQIDFQLVNKPETVRSLRQHHTNSQGVHSPVFTYCGCVHCSTFMHILYSLSINTYQNVCIKHC